MLTLLRYSRLIKGLVVLLSAIAALISGVLWYMHGTDIYGYWCGGGIVVGWLFIWSLKRDFANDEYIFEDARDLARHDIYDPNSR